MKLQTIKLPKKCLYRCLKTCPWMEFRSRLPYLSPVCVCVCQQMAKRLEMHTFPHSQIVYHLQEEMPRHFSVQVRKPFSAICSANISLLLDICLFRKSFYSLGKGLGSLSQQLFHTDAFVKLLQEKKRSVDMCR